MKKEDRCSSWVEILWVEILLEEKHWKSKDYMKFQIPGWDRRINLLNKLYQALPQVNNIQI